MLTHRSVPICTWQGTNARHVPLVCQRNLIALINGATHFNPSFNQNFTSYFAIVGTNVTDFSIGGSRGVLGAGPLRDPILSFLHTFSPKSAHVGGPHPPHRKSWIRHCFLLC